MPTRPAAKERDPKARIADAAVRVFAARGFDAASIQQVADVVDMSKQAVMHHFPTKEALRAGAYEEIGRRVEALYPDAEADLRSGSRDRYARTADVVAGHFADNVELARFVLRELLDQPKATRAWIARTTAPWMKLALAAYAENAGATRALDAEAHVAALASLLLVTSALTPDAKPAWRKRMRAAVMRLLDATDVPG